MIAACTTKMNKSRIHAPNHPMTHLQHLTIKVSQYLAIACIIERMTSKTFTINRRARFDYTLHDKYTAGLVLHGHEVKSVRAGGANLKGAFITISADGEAWLNNSHIIKYQSASTVTDYDPDRARKLLLNKKEINKLIEARAGKFTIIPISIFVAGPNIKLSLATATGKKNYDKRSSIKKRDIERQESRRFK